VVEFLTWIADPVEFKIIMLPNKSKSYYPVIVADSVGPILIEKDEWDYAASKRRQREILRWDDD